LRCLTRVTAIAPKSSKQIDIVKERGLFRAFSFSGQIIPAPARSLGCRVDPARLDVANLSMPF
jgi:hypothetical protein